MNQDIVSIAAVVVKYKSSTGHLNKVVATNYPKKSTLVSEPGQLDKIPI